MAVVLGAILVVGWLALVYISNQAFASRVTPPLQIIEVVRRRRRQPRRHGGSTEKIDVAGADAAAFASNNEEEAGDFEEPSVQQTPAAMLDAVSEAGESMAEVDLGAVMPSGGAGRQRQAIVEARHRRPRAGLRARATAASPASSAGASFSTRARSLEEYARQLDALNVELAVVIAARTSSSTSPISPSPTPTKRYGSGQEDDRLYFLWQGAGRKASDVALLKKAGIDVGESVVLQFYPAGVEERLAQLEVRYRGRQPGRDPRHAVPGRPRGEWLRFQGHRTGSAQ